MYCRLLSSNQVQLVEQLTSKVSTLESRVSTTLQNLEAKLVIMEGKMRFIEEQAQHNQQKPEDNTAKEKEALETLVQQLAQFQKLYQQPSKQNTVETVLAPPTPVNKTATLLRAPFTPKSEETQTYESVRSSYESATFLTSVPETMLRPTYTPTSTPSVSDARRAELITF
jgi:hypothetical protein